MIKFLLGVVVGIGLVMLAGYLFVARGGIFMGTDTKPLPLEETIAGTAINASIGKSANDQSPLPADETNLQGGAKVYMQALQGVTESWISRRAARRVFIRSLRTCFH